MRARYRLLSLLAIAGSVGCTDVLGFSEYGSICGPEAGALPGGRRWATRLGDAGVQRGLSVAVDSEGAVLVAGSFGGLLDTGADVLASPDGHDAYVLKLDAAGQPLWARAIAGTGHQYATQVIAVGDRVIVAGRFDGTLEACGQTFTALDMSDTDGLPDNDEGSEDVDKDGFVLAYDRDGACQWSAIVAGLGDQTVTGLAKGPGGEILVSGSFQGSLHSAKPCAQLQSQSGFDVYVTALTPEGACQWTKQLDFGGDDDAQSLATDGDASAFLVGSCDAGSSPPCDGGAGKDILLSRFPISGDDAVTSWAFGNAGLQSALSVIAGGRTVAITGRYLGNLDFGAQVPLSSSEVDAFFARLVFTAEDQVDPVASRSVAFPGVGPRVGVALAGDAEGLAVLAGDYGGTLNLGTGELPGVVGADSSNVFVGGVATGGEVEWATSFGDGKSKMIVNGAAVDDAAGDVILVGSLNGATTCGSDPQGGVLTSAGSNDLWITRLRMR